MPTMEFRRSSSMGFSATRGIRGVWVAHLRMADLHVWGSGAGAYSPERRRDLAATWGDCGRLVYVP
jgi:hypothetical protein